MASTILDFDKPFRSIKYKVETDKTGVFVDYTDFVDFINVYEKIDTGLTGAVSQDCDIMLNIPNFDTSWQTIGININIYISISSDNWASSFEYLWWEGISKEGTIISDKTVHLKAVSRLAKIIESKNGGAFSPGVQPFQAVFETLLSYAGVTFGTSIYPSNISSFSVPFIGLISGLQVGFILDEFCRACNYYYRYSQGRVVFDRIYYTGRLAQNGVKKTYNLSQIISFNSSLISGLAFNIVIAEGRTARQVASNIAGDYLYQNLQLNSLEIKAGQKLFLLIDDQDLIDYSSINDFIGVGITNSSYFKVYPTDDFSSGYNNTGVIVTTNSVIIKNNKTKCLIVLENSNSSSRFLKELFIKGGGIIQTSLITDTATQFIAGGFGQNKEITINSDYITTESQAATITSEIIANFNSFKKYYQITIKGHPDNKVGDIIKIQDRLSNFLDVVIIEIDSEISRDRGFEQTITVKEV